MKVPRLRRRPLTVALAVLSWFAVGLSAPILINALSPRAPIDDASVVAAGFDSHVFNAPVALDAANSVTIRSGRLALVGRSGEPLPPDQIAALLKNGGGRLELARGTLQLGGDGTPPAVADVTTSSPIVRALATLAFETLTLRETTVELRLPGDQLEYLSATQLVITPRRGGQVGVTGTATWRGQRVEIDALLGGTETGAAERGVPARVRLTSALIDTTFEGRIGHRGAITLHGQSQSVIADLRKLTREFGLGWQAGAGFRDVRIAGKLAWVERALAFETAQVELDGHRAEGAFSIRTGSRRPLISGTLDFAALDLARYLAPPTETAAAATASTSISPPMWTPEGLWARAEDLLRLPLALALDTDLRLSAKDLRFASTRFGRAAASVTLRRGQLVTQIAELEIGRGTASGQLSVNFNALYPKLALQGRLDKADVGELTASLLGRRPLSGAGTVLFDLKSEGATIDELKRGLAGSIELSMDPGARLAVDLAQLWSAPMGLDTGSQARLLRSALRGAVGVESLEVECAISGPRVNCPKASAVAGDRAITGFGTYLTDQGRFDSTFVVSRRAVDTAAQAAGGAAATPASPLAASLQPAQRTLILKSERPDQDATLILDAQSESIDGPGQALSPSATKRRNGT